MPKFCNISPAKCANCSDMTVNCCHLYNILTPDSLSDSQRLWMAKVLHQWQWCSMQYRLISISLINLNQTLWLKALVLLEVFILLLTIIGCMPQHNRSRRLACCFSTSQLTTSCLSSSTDHLTMVKVKVSQTISRNFPGTRVNQARPLLLSSAHAFQSIKYWLHTRSILSDDFQCLTVPPSTPPLH